MPSRIEWESCVSCGEEVREGQLVEVEKGSWFCGACAGVSTRGRCIVCGEEAESGGGSGSGSGSGGGGEWALLGKHLGHLDCLRCCECGEGVSGEKEAVVLGETSTEPSILHVACLACRDCENAINLGDTVALLPHKAGLLCKDCAPPSTTATAANSGLACPVCSLRYHSESPVFPTASHEAPLCPDCFAHSLHGAFRHEPANPPPTQP